MFGERQRAPDINPGSCPPKKYIKKASHRSSPFCILLFLRVLLKQKPQNLRQADPAAFPFSSGVHPWPTGSAILYPPLVTRARWGHWTSWAFELSRAAASQHWQHIWLCVSGFVANQLPPSYLSSSEEDRSNQLKWGEWGSELRVSFPLPFLPRQPECAIHIPTNTICLLNKKVEA